METGLWRSFFGDMALDGVRRELRSGSTLLPIEPQVFDLLQFLITNRERVVSRDELLAAVWSGRVVSDWPLTRASTRPDARSVTTAASSGGYAPSPVRDSASLAMSAKKRAYQR